MHLVWQVFAFSCSCFQNGVCTSLGEVKLHCGRVGRNYETLQFYLIFSILHMFYNYAVSLYSNTSTLQINTHFGSMLNNFKFCSVLFSVFCRSVAYRICFTDMITFAFPLNIYECLDSYVRLFSACSSLSPITPVKQSYQNIYKGHEFDDILTAYLLGF